MIDEGAIRARYGAVSRLLDDRARRLMAGAEAINASVGGGIDDVIDPADTRDWIANSLRRMPPIPARTGKKYPYIDPW